MAVDFSKYHTKYLLKALREFQVHKSVVKSGYGYEIFSPDFYNDITEN